jgi:hypoxanthine phosphoribosyltransferase
VEASGNSFSVEDQTQGDGSWNVLVVDDLYDTGASMGAACQAA